MKRIAQLAVAGVGIALTLTACATQGGHDVAGPVPTSTSTAPRPPASDAAHPTTSAPAGGAPLATSAPTTSAPAGGAPLATPPPAAAVGSAGCPVTAETLLTALKSDDARFIQAGRPAALEGVVCHSAFAVVHSAPDGVHQPPKTLFGYSDAAGAWKPLVVSGGIHFCRDYVTDDIAQHLPNC
ncbi:hypothetical protein Lfu02_47590 [Longispora fulva]|uniref:Lipoprotein n=1 Tax=Longispora fulva TaxID=619741 RepID=A0A8J7GT66_9ACTN|nr:hypothetical protein [Longispora fulva]MBG6138134.1 hypothetical protein [Longispora fulva]GIG60387.1 hypothetical protein Lfu02_47590 [Longispora fulva]